MDNGLRHRELTRRLWVGTIAINICLQFTILLMSIQSPEQWNDEEVLALEDHLEVNSHNSVVTTVSTPLSSSDQPVTTRSKGSKGGSSRHSGVSGQSTEDSVAPAEDIALASAIIGMQGSINRLIDIFEQSMSHLAEDPTVSRLSSAIRLMQEQEDDLTMDQKIAMISCFTRDVNAANTYISLYVPEVRRAWISIMLSKEMS